MRVLLTDIPDIEEDHDGCKYTPCPVEAGKQYNFNYSRYVNLIYPAVIHYFRDM